MARREIDSPSCSQYLDGFCFGLGFHRSLLVAGARDPEFFPDGGDHGLSSTGALSHWDPIFENFGLSQGLGIQRYHGHGGSKKKLPWRGGPPAYASSSNYLTLKYRSKLHAPASPLTPTSTCRLDRHTYRQTGRQTDRQGDRQAGRQAGRQTGTNRQTKRH